jgi:hypothetical protein
MTFEDTMNLQRSIQRWTFGALVTVAVAAPVSPTAAGALQETGVTRAPSVFQWPGVFDLVATGYPDGERKAVMHIARTDTSYSLVSLQGPPGVLMRFTVSGDSAHVVWNLGTGVMVVDLRGAGDSLTGEWESGDWSGTLRGTRRR